jgi:hypothetical protein
MNTIIDTDDPRLQQPGRYSLGNNLYLRVRSPANRQFSYRYRLAGRLRDKTLGSANKITIEQARALATAFRQQIDADRLAVPAYTLPPRLATIRRLGEQLARTQRLMQRAVEEVNRLSRQFEQIICAPSLALDAALASLPDDTGLAGDQAGDQTGDQADEIPPIVRPRGREPLYAELKLAVESYYRTAIANGFRPTKSGCRQVLQDHGYWPEKSESFMYQNIGRYWPQPIFSTPEE